MQIAIGSDHGGYQLKCQIVEHLKTKGLHVVDFGTDSEASCDYPDYGYQVAKAVQSGQCDRGIVICGTGQGIMMSANKVKGIRCALLSDVFSAEMVAQHNDANMIAMGGRVLGVELAKRIVDAYLAAEFEGGRHARRVAKITAIETNFDKE
ncbi:MAG: ribose 5-phosphate isomerase B [Clostridiales bacterium]|nr:MAG: ribose 5-phosphate isomerase B [Clostridiales bacterium]